MSIQTEARFPPITGETLTGRTLHLPGDFEAPLNLVFVAFRRAHQSDVDTWAAVADDLESEFPNVRSYELAVISRRYAPARVLIDRGIRAGVPDTDTRDRTVTVYTDKRVVRRALDIDGEDEIHALLVDPEGTVYWRAAGPKDVVAADHLREVVASLT